MYGCYSQVYVRCRAAGKSFDMYISFGRADVFKISINNIERGVDRFKHHRTSLIATKGDAQNYVESKKAGKTLNGKTLKCFIKQLVVGWPRSH